MAALLLLRAATAAEPDTPDVLPPWIVTESRLRPDTTPVRASSLVPGEAWSDRAVVTLADAFRQIPGAVMQESFGGFEPPRLSIRGSGVQSAPSSRGVALLLDDLPLGLADGSFNSALLDPGVGHQVEVQRGLDGWRVAPATMGGALDLRSTGAAAAPASALRVETGSFGALRAKGSYSKSRDSTAAGVVVSSARQRGYRAHGDQARTVALASFATELAAPATFRISLYEAHARYEVPGPLTLAAAIAAPRTVSSDVERDQPQRVAELTRLAGTLSRRTALEEWELGASVARTADDFRQLQPNGVMRSRSTDASLRATFARRFSAIGLPQQLRLTATADRGWREVERWRNDSGRTGAAFGHDGLYPTTAVFQFEEALAPTPALVVTTGVARVVARRRIVDRVGPGTNLHADASDTLPQVGGRWKVSPDIALFATGSRSVEPPTFDDLLVVAGTYPALQRRVQPLVSQRATTWEIGARGRTDRLAWDVAVYRAGWHNEILRLADARGATRGGVNATPTTHAGIEAAARWVVRDGSPRVSLSAVAAWNDIRFRHDPDYGAGRLAGVPPQLGDAELRAETRRGVFAAVAADWTHGDTRVDHAGRLSYGGRTLVSLRCGWRRASHWTWFVEARNLFDRQSIASTAGVLDLARNPAATVIFLPATGRSLNAGLEWKR